MTFVDAGAYTITLTVTDNDGLTDTAQRTVVVTEAENETPVAVINATPTIGAAPLTVMLDGISSTDDGSVVGYAWTSSDGQSVRGSQVQITFEEEGVYTITLTVTDDQQATGTMTETVRVSAPGQDLPVAVISASPVRGEAPLPVELDGSESTDADGSVSEFSWSTSDGQSAVGRQVSLVFDEAGSYVVTLTVADNDGLTDSTSQTIMVEEAVCAQVITWGLSPEAGAWEQFSTPCDVPEGWETSETEPAEDLPRNYARITIDGETDVIKRFGDSLDVHFGLYNFAQATRMDIYFAMMLPNGSLMFAQSTGGFFDVPAFSTVPVPYLENTLIPDMEGQFVYLPELPHDLPTGTYDFYAVTVLPGHDVMNGVNWIGGLAHAQVTLGR